MHSLVKLFIANNSLTGQLPAQWFTTADMFPKLMDIDLRWNKLHGPVPGLDNGRTLQPRVYIAPMDEGFGLCERFSANGPLIFKSDTPEDDDMFFGDGYFAAGAIREHSYITTLPSCPSGKPHVDMLERLH
jgi:hypothetical protein